MESFKTFVINLDFIMLAMKSVKISEPGNDVKSDSGVNQGAGQRVGYRTMGDASERARSVPCLSGNKDRRRKDFLQQHFDGFNVPKKE